tara:strand:+ start:638 stop:1474 length:837 start_codon:yes stop_codon:yes gene_type:complete
VKKIYIKDLQELKKSNQKFAAITAYDFLSARAIEELGFPIILVGDSASMVVYGYSDTVPVSMDEMLFVLRAVVRGASSPLIVADMPFLSYQASVEDAIKNAGLFLKNGAGAVKLEGGESVSRAVEALVGAGIPVMGHIGLMPQSINTMSGYSIQGKDFKGAKKIINDALALQDAGVFSVVLEGVPLELAEKITSLIDVPTIGIGSGLYCDGQIQVFHDVVGLCDGFVPRHAKKYINSYELFGKALSKYKKDVEGGSFPKLKHSTSMQKEILKNISENN